MKKELDKTISAIVLAALAVIWLILLITSHCGVSDGVMRGIGIAKDVILGLVYFVLLYNAWGWSENIIVRIIFLVIFLFLVFCIVGQYFPAIFPTLPIPYIRL